MTAWKKPVKRLKRVRGRNAEEALARLKSYLEGDLKEPVRILCGFWKDQQNAISYQELREAVKTGALDEDTYRLWSQDYSVLVTKHLKPVWEEAMRAGSMSQPVMHGLSFDFNMHTPGIMDWIKNRGAAFVTASSEEQKSAIQALLAKKMVEGHTVDELAKFIRPCIGLAKPQAEANRRYYEIVVKTLKEGHPRMKRETVERKAREAAAKYAEKQHRQRAMTIARTESAYAYNRGADEGIRQAQAHGLLGKMEKRWSTSGDGCVCSMCASLEGTEIGIDESFGIKGEELFKGQHMLPPAHPNCACAIEYIEIEPLAAADFPQTDSNGGASFREYTAEEIETMAEKMDETASRHISVPGKWSGKVIVEGNKGGAGYGKMWNCDIKTGHMTAPHILLHELIHARSVSYYDKNAFPPCRNIEEASVQFMAQEISRLEGIEVIESGYDEMVDALRRLRERAGAYQTDYDFAKALIEIPMINRLDWLTELLYGKMRADESSTLEDYMEVTNLLDILHTYGG